MAETRVEITAIDNTAAAFKSAGFGLQRLGRQILSAQTAMLGLVGAGGLGLLVRNAFQSGDAMAKMSDRLGIATENLAGLQHAADLAGVGSETLNLALRGLSKNVIDAARGTGEVQAAFDRLGISAGSLAQLSLDDQFALVGEKLASVGNATERNALAMQLFGSRASDVLDLFAGGSSSIKKAAEEAQAVGAALSRIDAAKLEQANDAMTRVRLVLKGIGNTIAIETAPYLTVMAQRFFDAAKQSNGFRKEVLATLEFMAKGLAVVDNILYGVRVGWLSLRIAVRTVTISVLDFLHDVDVQFTDLYNKIAGTSIGKTLGLDLLGYSTGLNSALADARMGMEKLQQDLYDMVVAGFPGDRVVAFFQKIKDEAEKAGQEINNRRPKPGPGGDGFDPIQGEGFGRMEEQLRSRIERMAESQLTEREQLALHLQQTQMMLDEAFVLGLISEQQHNRLFEAEELNHLARIGDANAKAKLEGIKFNQMTLDEKLKTTISYGVQELQGVANSNKKLFKIHQALSLAQLAIEAPAAIGAAIKRGGGLPFGAVFGAITAAKYVALIAQARAAQFGSSTSPANVAGGSAIPVTSASTAPAPEIPGQSESARSNSQIQIIIQGNVIGNEQYIDQLVDGIRDRIENRDVVLFSGRSRQALELVPG